MKDVKEIFGENAYDSKIVLENGDRFLSLEERELIEIKLNNVEIEFACVEINKGIQNSFLNGVEVFINENLTLLIVGGLFMPALYDALKFVVKKIRKGLKKGSVRIVTPNRAYIPPLILRFKTKKGELKAPIPNELTDVQFKKYMDSLISSMQSLTDDKISKEELIVDYKTETEKIHILTRYEYIQKKSEEQHKENDIN